MRSSNGSLAHAAARRSIGDIKLGAELGKADRYEALVHTTAGRWDTQIDLPFDDVKQELRVVAWKAQGAFDPSKVRGGFEEVGLAQDRFVFSCLRNKIKDLVRDSYARKRRATVVYIEDVSHPPNRGPGAEQDHAQADAWELRHLSINDEEVYAPVIDGVYMVPPGVTEFEGEVLLLLMLDFSQIEIANRLRVSVHRIRSARGRLVEKMRGWEPAPGEPARLLPAHE